MRHSSKLWAMTVAALLAGAGHSFAGSVVYTFDNGAPPGSTYTTQPTNPQVTGVAPISLVNDTASPTVTATFFSTGGASSAIIVPSPGGNANFVANVLEMVTPGETVIVRFSQELSSLSFDYYVPANNDNIFGNQLNVTFQQQGVGGNIPGSPPGPGDPLGGALSGTYSFIPSSPGPWFNQLTLSLGATSGPAYIDNLQGTPVPEIDPASSAGALTLLGSAVVMLRGRCKLARV